MLQSLLYTLFTVIVIYCSSIRATFPVVIWHGMGDSYLSDGMQHTVEKIQKIRPASFIYVVRLSQDGDSDKTASIWGSVNAQVDCVYQELQEISELAGGFDAIGFSQGGLFLRAYIERYNTPMIRNLVTFGSPHLGISDIPCSPGDSACKRRNRLLIGQVWSTWAQTHIVQAQYFRDPRELDKYREHSVFLADVNNEGTNDKNSTYYENFSRLNKLVLVRFDQDTTLIPRDSAWFDDFNPNSGTVIDMKDTPLYKQDWIGLAKLDHERRIFFDSIDNEHMHIPEAEFIRIMEKYSIGQQQQQQLDETQEQWLIDEEGQDISIRASKL